MKKLFPISLIAFIAVLGTSCKKEAQEVPEQTVNKVKSAFNHIDVDDTKPKHMLSCTGYTKSGDSYCLGCWVPK